MRGLEADLKASDDQSRKLEDEIETIRTDRARFNAALIDTNAKVQAAEARTSDLEKQVETARGREDALNRTLAGRRALIGEILAALQRIDRNPPPAVLVSPQDMMRAVHSAMLLGDVLPELRSETKALASDLADLAAIRQSIDAERQKLADEKNTLAGEQQRLSGLVAARQNSLDSAKQALDGERRHAQDLAGHATDLKDLIAKMTAGSAAPGGADSAHQAPAPAAPGESQMAALTPFKDPARLAPAIAFADAKGMLPLPVSGSLLKSFGAPDGFGGLEKGLSIATRAGAAVSSPTDGWIAFSGPYRTYGQLLIINGGGGYYVVLAGLSQVNVVVGQFVLAGEPVASMGDGSAQTAAAIAIGATQPVLYVEFRKDGVAIDPGPWWAKAEQEKVRG
ncbi:MAG TPA: peptidoglycan DD-metalloendopeptidase family protein [Beijerinckiaceae bacterium]|nr:peptidoglycan DD-metalloendopeptidase family protein [Beijerinckiaceae bacterium]